MMIGDEDTGPALITRLGGPPYPNARHRRLVLMGYGPIGSLCLRRRRPFQCASLHRDQMRDNDRSGRQQR